MNLKPPSAKECWMITPIPKPKKNNDDKPEKRTTAEKAGIENKLW